MILNSPEEILGRGACGHFGLQSGADFRESNLEPDQSKLTGMNCIVQRHRIRPPKNGF